MTKPALADDFLASVAIFSEFGRIADAASFRPLPADWVVGIADVVDSTGAIAAGRYKAVNMAGAAVIAAVTNALAGAAFPFAFGGDGASFAVPPAHAPAARDALAATAVLVGEEFGLTLRVAQLPLAAIRAAGHDVTLALLAASPDVSYAMFAGGGIAWAEERMKAGEFAVPAAAPGTRPDLNGLSCRWEETPSRHGTVLSVIARPARAGSAEYAALVSDILALVEASPDMARPIPASGPPLAWPGPGFDLEARTTRRPGASLLMEKVRLLTRSALSTLLFRFRVPVGGFNPDRYISQLVANSDYRKYDDGLRMTIDCSPDLAAAIEARLARAEREGIARYGLHRQTGALVTCITPSAMRADHIHFVDGAAGGYAAAAARLKG